jgi:hypothetical protein
MVELIELPRIVDSRGNLTFLQESVGCPFEIQRVFWTFNVPGGSVRGGHAYKTQQELIVAINGAFDVVVRETGGSESRYRLDRGDVGLFLPNRTWRRMESFSTNGVGLHLMSGVFDADDYIREHARSKSL